MNKKISIGLSSCITLLAVIVTIFVTGYISRNNVNRQFKALSQRQQLFQKLSEVDGRVRENYFFDDDIDEKKLADMTVSGYVQGLSDKYAAYYSSDDYKKKSEENKGNYSGVGVVISETDGQIKIESVLNGSPAQTAGIRTGDIIRAVNDEAVNSENIQKSLDLLMGDIGEELKITIFRDNQEITVYLKISEYDLISATQEILNDKYGIIKITEFNDKTVEQFEDAIKTLQDNGIEDFVFDLRNNPGGTTDSVCAILDKLVGSGDLMVADYKNGETKTLFSSDSSEINGNMVVIVNENTASAAELFTEVMRDYGKAKIVGTNTYGKGVMQTTFKLSDGSALKLTTALYRSAKSENFDGVGVAPDVTAELTDAQKNNPELSLEEDLQIQTAIKVLDSTK